MKRFHTEATLPDALKLNGVHDTHKDYFLNLPIFFYVSKSENHNIVTYRANLKPTGLLDLEEPLIPTWIKYTKGVSSKTKQIYEQGITFFEKPFYGVTVHKKSVDAVTVYINALGSKHLISLCTKENKSLSARITYENKVYEFLSAHATLNRLGISIKRVVARVRDLDTGKIIEQEVPR
eukprot:snap_masked-scaffold_69-processed-gene-0.22-mRNA-1 protein AED:1.00 eAED:1.00 QI:0/-1/0/0/-1/1/1/0/178